MPLAPQLHIDGLLTNVSAKYENAEYIHASIFPELPVGKGSDKIRTYVRNIRLQETLRTDKGEARDFSFEMTNSAYSVEHHALKDIISQDEKEDNDVGDLRADTVENLTDGIMLRKEKDFADLFATTGNWSNNMSLTAAQSFALDTTTSAPVAFFDTATGTVLKESGKIANKCILPYDGYIAVKNHSSIIDRIKHTSRDITKDMIGALLGVEDLKVPAAQNDTSAQGLTSTLSNLFEDNAWVGYSAPRPGLKTPSAGYMIQRKSKRGLYVNRWTEEKLDNAEVIEVNCKYQFKIISSLSGFLLRDIV